MPSSGGQKSALDRKSTRLNFSHGSTSYAVFCLKKKTLFSVTSRYAWSRERGSTRSLYPRNISCFFSFFFNDTATTEIYTLSLHDALPISSRQRGPSRGTSGASPREGG